MKDYKVRLTKRHAETFRKAGKDSKDKGNMSAGARRLADEWENREMKKSDGMTLVELLVVVGICAILAALALSAYARCHEPAKDVSLRARVHQCSVALLSEDPQNARIPTTNGDADAFAAMKEQYAAKQIEVAVQLVENRTQDILLPTHEVEGRK